MTAAGDWRMNRAGNGEYLTPLLGGQTGGDQRTALGCRFNHQDAARQAGNDAVAARKVVGDRRGAERKLGHDGAAFGNRDGQLLVARRVNAVGAGPDDGDRLSLGGEGATVGGCIDTEGEAADNAQALGGQVPGEALGSLDTLRGGIAAADHGDSASVQQVGITANVQYAGWVGDFEQGRRIAAIRQGDDALAGLAGPRQAVLDGFRWCAVEQQIGLVTDDAAHLKAPGGKDRLG